VEARCRFIVSGDPAIAGETGRRQYRKRIPSHLFREEKMVADVMAAGLAHGDYYRGFARSGRKKIYGLHSRTCIFLPQAGHW
jgi:hypothetical protein